MEWTVDQQPIGFRVPFSTHAALQRGLTHGDMRWAVKTGELHRICRGAYLEGPDPPTAIERALGITVAANAIACGTLAATLLEFDGVGLAPPYGTVVAPSRSARREIRQSLNDLAYLEIAPGIHCTNGLQTLIDLSRLVTDACWEQALESALRSGLVMIDDLECLRADQRRSRDQGALRIRRVLALRPNSAPPTESLLETLMVQLIRRNPELPDPERQVIIRNKYNDVIGRVDLCWPAARVFVELDGRHHGNQLLYDTSRETAIIAATGWLPARFTWYEITRTPTAALRKLTAIYQRGAGV